MSAAAGVHERPQTQTRVPYRPANNTPLSTQGQGPLNYTPVDGYTPSNLFTAAPYGDTFTSSSQNQTVGQSSGDTYTPTAPKKKGYTPAEQFVHDVHVGHAAADALELGTGAMQDGFKGLAGHFTGKAHHHGSHGSHGTTTAVTAADDLAPATQAVTKADDLAPVATAATKADDVATTANAVTKPLRDLDSANLSSDTKEMYQAIRDQMARESSTTKAATVADETSAVAKAAVAAEETSGIAKAAGAADEVGNVGRFAQTTKVLAGVGKGAAALGSVVALPTGILQTYQGVNETAKGIKTGDNKKIASGVLNTGSGAALTTSGVAGTMVAGGQLGLVSAGAAAAAAPVALAAGGAAAALDGSRQVVKNWSDRSKDYKVGAGMLKTGGGTAMMAGAAMMATGVGAPVGAALVVGGAVVTAGTYLAENTEVGKTVTKAVGKAAHAVADGVGHAVSEGAEIARNVGGAISDGAGALADGASSLWNKATSWW
jgi:negative regulator of sigma E activity